jgi:tetratricopeptide (TPR) repeat protein
VDANAQGWGTYSADDVAALLKLPTDRLRSFVSAGLVQPALMDDGQPRFSFRDLVVVRTLNRLIESGVPESGLRTALEGAQRGQLPASEQPTPPVAHWENHSNQGSFDFGSPPPAPVRGPSWQQVEDAEQWFKLGCDLEASQPPRAREAYLRAVQLNPVHPDAHINLGRLLHEAKDAAGAERHYRAALEARPRDATAAFNLGTALEDLRRYPDAIGAYARAIEADPGCADAYFNLARLYERAGRRAEAFRHLRAYKQLADGA